MIGHRKLPICALDFDVGGDARDTEHLVKISFCISGQKLLTLKN
jgi:hypothetical protein